MQVQANDLTKLLADWEQGDRAALEGLPVFRQELRNWAQRHLGHERRAFSAQLSSLVNEAFLRFLPRRPISFQDREHFFALALRTMRQVLLDHTCRTQRVTPGNRATYIPIDAAIVPSPEQLNQVVSIGHYAGTVKCRGGRAGVSKCAFSIRWAWRRPRQLWAWRSRMTMREWNFVRGWLQREFRG